MVNFGGALAHASKKQKDKNRKGANRTPNKRKPNPSGQVTPQKEQATNQTEDWESDKGGKDAVEEIRQNTLLGRFLDFIEPFIVFLIVANAAMMGIGTFDFVTEDPEMEEIFEQVDEVFLIIFTVEVTLASIHYLRFDRIKKISGSGIEFQPMSREERKERRMNLPWILFDATVVILSWAFNHLSIIRSFRILRALRLVSKIESMKRVVGGLFAVGPRMGMVAFMLSILFTVFGVAFTMLFRDFEYDNDIDYFGTFDKSFLTLFQIMTFDSWKAVARQTMDQAGWSWTLFVLWVLISGFVIMNLIIAIICESLVMMKWHGDGEDSLDSSHSHALSQSQTRTSITSDVHMKMDYDLVWINDTVGEILKDQDELLDAVEDVKKIVHKLIMQSEERSEKSENSETKKDLKQILRLLS